MFNYVSDEVYATLDELMVSKKVIDTSRGPIWFEFPYADDRLYSRHLFDKSKKEYEENGIPNAAEAKREHIECGLWTEEQERYLNDILPNFLKQIQDKLAIEKNLVRKRKFEAKLRQLNIQLSELSAGYHSLMANTSEYMAYRNAIAFMIWRCFRDINGDRIWQKYEDILKEPDIDFIEELITAFNTNEEISDMSLLRKIARNPQWRVRWKTSGEDVFSLFGRHAKDLTTTQFMLVYWSQLYDNVFESIDRPPMSVIENDEELDKWIDKRGQEMERELKQKFEGSSKLVKNSKIDSSPEVFKIVSGYYNDDGEYILYTDEERWQQIEKMRGLNTDSSRAAQRVTEEKLKEFGGRPMPEQQIKNKHAIEATGGTIIKKGKGR